MKKRNRGLVLAGGAKPQLRRVRKREWTAAKRRAFIDELAATCNIQAALRVVGMSDSGLYKLRKRDARFRAEWAEALREGYAKLEMMALERAMNGTVKTVTRANGSVDKTHEYPNGLALALLKMHRQNAAAANAEYDEEDIEEVRRRIARKLAALRKRMEAEEIETGRDMNEPPKEDEKPPEEPKED